MKHNHFTQGLCTCLFLGALSLTAACSGNTGHTSSTETISTETAASGEADAGNTAFASYTVDCDTSVLTDESRISDTLYGIFLEDINFAVDGGLYAELIKNRSFEYGAAAANEGMHGWINSNSDVLTFAVTDGSADGTCLNENNPHYAVLTNTGDGWQGIANVGYLDGLAVTEGEAYRASIYVKGNGGYTGAVRLSLENADKTVYAEELLPAVTDDWAKYEVTLTPNATVSDDLHFCVQITAGSVSVDMVSLMPEDTYKDLPIRKDIGNYLEGLHPSFLRFPGGCVIEGKDEESMYNWKDSIGNGLKFTINGETTVGDVAARVQGKDIWSGTKQDPYYTTYGIGFYEYFLLCEALDCLPVPVLNAGMTCEVQSAKYTVYPLTSGEFQQCVQDALDLVEFCLGGETTEWGAVRIAMGHTDPFPLKYIAIGNEQWQSEYHAHYEKFVEAFEDAAKENPALYGEIELIVANGTASGSMEGWDYIEDYPDSITTLVDEHYYESPSWFLSNTKRYDSYDRTAQAKVFLGEYAAQSNTLEAALAEAAYMTGLERNGDIVQMACYAPLFGNSKTNQWTPDLLFFSNDSLYGSVNYYVQKLFANNVGTAVLPSSLELESVSAQTDLSGCVGLGSWQTSVAYDNLCVTSNTDGSTLYACDFEDADALKSGGFTEHEGEWLIEGGKLVQKNTADPFDTNTGDAVYVGDTEWSNYTMTVDAEILSGNEGFLLPVCVQDSGNNIFWNIGGWGNTVSCLQIVSGNSKSGQVSGTVKNLVLKQNEVYHLKVVVDGNTIQCYLNDTLYIDYTKETTEAVYETASVDESGDLILKFVNTTAGDVPVNTTLEHFTASDYEETASVTTLSGDKLNETNSFDDPEHLIPAESSLPIGETFSCTLPHYSVTIVRIAAR